ncbi:MAG: hypothetical protein AAF804_06855, partial [Bacteroidota bacterium]
MPSKKQVYRLFKVAKELNVGTSLLVEHLQHNGHDVAPSPNTKLSSDQYDILLKEFASEKLIKERADQLAEERRREEAIQQAANEVAKPAAEAEESSLTAADLRNQIKAPAHSETPPPPVEKEKAAVEMKSVSTPEPVVPETSQSSPAEKAASNDGPSGLKVLGHVDINQYNKKGKKTEPEAKAPVKKTPKVSEPEKKAKAEPDKEKREEVVESEAPQTPEVKAEEKAPAKPKEEKPAAVEAKAPAEDKQAAPPPAEPSTKAEEQSPSGEQEEDKEESTLYRAEDRAPKLSGLKVMGKIELPGDKKKKKKDEEASTTDNKGKSGEGDGEGEDGTKKRRRRR